MESMEGSAVGTELSSHGTPASIFFFKTHVDLISRLIEECPHSLIEHGLLALNQFLRDLVKFDLFSNFDSLSKEERKKKQRS
jgi:hypothetical protein